MTYQEPTRPNPSWEALPQPSAPLPQVITTQGYHRLHILAFA